MISSTPCGISEIAAAPISVATRMTQLRSPSVSFWHGSGSGATKLHTSSLGTPDLVPTVLALRGFRLAAGSYTLAICDAPTITPEVF